jgi:hypothetical protein
MLKGQNAATKTVLVVMTTAVATVETIVEEIAVIIAEETVVTTATGINRNIKIPI